MLVVWISLLEFLTPLFQVPGHSSVFIGEPRLSDFKQVLTRNGIQAEFAGGALICNNVVAVKRVSSFCFWKLFYSQVYKQFRLDTKVSAFFCARPAGV